MSVLIEAAVESLDDALAAVEGGADRLELCANLAAGGTTPPPSLVAAALERFDLPVFVMIRARGGSFTYSAAELDRMGRDIESMRELGADGIVVGVLDARGLVDPWRMEPLIAAAGELPITFHRAFDRVPDRCAALEALIDLRVDRVLTSGGAPSALAGADAIRELVEHAGDEIVIMAGGGVRPNNAAELVDSTGVRELHARCELDSWRIAEIRRAVAAL